MISIGAGTMIYLALMPVDFRRGLGRLNSHARNHSGIVLVFRARRAGRLPAATRSCPTTKPAWFCSASDRIPGFSVNPGQRAEAVAPVSDGLVTQICKPFLTRIDTGSVWRRQTGLMSAKRRAAAGMLRRAFRCPGSRSGSACCLPIGTIVSGLPRWAAAACTDCHAAWSPCDGLDIET